MANQTSNPASAALGLGAGQGSGGGVPVAPQALAEKPKRQGGGGRGGNTKGPVDADPGQSTVKLYWLTKGEMWALGGVGFIWSLFYSVGSFLIGFSIDAAMNVELAQGVSAEVLARWEAYSYSAKVAGICCFVVATIAVVGTGFGISGVLKRTTHRKKEPDVPR